MISEELISLSQPVCVILMVNSVGLVKSYSEYCIARWGIKGTRDSMEMVVEESLEEKGSFPRSISLKHSQ